MLLRNFSWSPICAPICSLNKGYLDLVSKSIPKKYPKYIQNTRDGRKLGLYWKWLWVKRVNKSNRNMASMVGNWHEGSWGWLWRCVIVVVVVGKVLEASSFFNYGQFPLLKLPPPARPTTTVLVCSCGYCHCADSLHLVLLFFFSNLLLVRMSTLMLLMITVKACGRHRWIWQWGPWPTG